MLSEGRWRLYTGYKITLSPTIAEHQGDKPWCPYYAGVPIMRGSLLCGCPYYAGVAIMRGSLLCGCAYYAGVSIMGGSLLCGGRYYAGVPIMRGPYYAGVPIMRGSLLCGCAYYAGVHIMRGSLLYGCPCYAGVPIMRGSLLSAGPSKKTKTSRTYVLSIWSRKQTFSVETFVQILNFNSNKFILKKPNDLLSY